MHYQIERYLLEASLEREKISLVKEQKIVRTDLNNNMQDIRSTLNTVTYRYGVRRLPYTLFNH